LEVEGQPSLWLLAERQQRLPRQLRLIGRDPLLAIVADHKACVVEHSRRAAIAIPPHHFVRRFFGQPKLGVVRSPRIRAKRSRVTKRIDAEQDAVCYRRLQQRNRVWVKRAMPFVLDARRKPQVVAIPQQERHRGAIRRRTPRAAARARQLAHVLQVDRRQFRPVDERAIDFDRTAIATARKRDGQRHRLTRRIGVERRRILRSG